MTEVELRRQSHGGPMDFIAILLGATSLVWFLFWLATAVAQQPLTAQLPPELHNVVAFLGNWITVSTAGAGSILVWFLRRNNLSLTTYLGWVAGLGLGSSALVLAISHLIPTPTSDYSEEDRAYLDGQAMMSNSDWKEAERYLSKVTPKNPHYFAAMNMRGRAEFFLKDYAKAEQSFKEEFSVAKTQDEKLDARRSVARVRMAAGDYEYARDELAKLIVEPRFSESPSVIYNLADAYYDTKQYDDAATVLRRFPFERAPVGDNYKDIWGVAYFLRAKLTSLNQPLNCKSIRADISSAQQLVPDVMTRMDPSKELLSCLT